ncbi:MAG: hypothetical protein ABJM26_22065 [Anderseniella sp.]|uniref:hypothetical protein n=1 Tax=Parasphingorhabdus sp. TaxID=2709688 RepID=UPI00328DCB03
MATDIGFDAYFISDGIHAKAFDDMNSAAKVTKTSSTVKSQYYHFCFIGLCDRLRWVRAQILVTKGGSLIEGAPQLPAYLQPLKHLTLRNMYSPILSSFTAIV